MDESYEVIATLQKMLVEHRALVSLQENLPPMRDIILSQSPEQAMSALKALGEKFNGLTNVDPITSKISRARRALRGNSPDQEKSINELMVAIERLAQEISWRSRAAKKLMPELQTYEQSISKTIGMRLQEKLTVDQAESVASCLAVHKDISLFF